VYIIVITIIPNIKYDNYSHLRLVKFETSLGILMILLFLISLFKILNREINYLIDFLQTNCLFFLLYYYDI